MSLAWLPNALTLSRLFFAAVVLIASLRALAADECALAQLWHQLAFLAFVAGALTDLIDGWAARFLKAETRFGIWLDPIADKVLIACALLALAVLLRSWLIYIPAALIIARDVFMTWVRTRPEAAGVVAPSRLAKFKTALEMLAIASLLLPFALTALPGEATEPAGLSAHLIAAALTGLLWLAAVLSLVTAGQYVRAVRKR